MLRPVLGCIHSNESPNRHLGPLNPKNAPLTGIFFVGPVGGIANYYVKKNVFLELFYLIFVGLKI